MNVHGARGAVRAAAARATTALLVVALLVLALFGVGLVPAARGAEPPADPGYSATALYNAGNAYAQAGKPGLAVLSYERARLLDPTDPDISANLNFVRQSAGLPAQAPGPRERIARMAGPQLLWWLGLLGLVMVGGSALAKFRYPRARAARWAGAAVGLCLMSLTVANAVALWPFVHGAVVLTNDTPVRVSPVPMGDPLFALPEAETVVMRAAHDEFILIETRAGRTGWVSRANVEPIVPLRER